MKKMYTMIVTLMVMVGVNAQNVIYSNDFEDGAGDATIIGSGEIIDSENPAFGHVFHNAVGGQAVRANYLLLPDDVFANLQAAETNELTISFWVNEGTATDYRYTPLFSAYGAAPDPDNTWPMMVLQTRLFAQVNNAGWSDFTNAQNDAGTNFESEEWLNDGEWHFYAATFTPTSAAIYVDGVLQNSWTLSGDDNGGSAGGLFTNGEDLTYIALGGNQAWNWNDVDAAFMFDDLVIYSDVLTVEQMNAIMDSKLTVSSAVDQIGVNNGDVVSKTYFNIAGANVGSDFDTLIPGVYIKRVVYSNGVTESTKVIKTRR
ncbi:LamG-like jellyroll fold domain-containing protein [Alkalitalea saponilacus]|uniref:Concanavalin A-like lectin/glucanases superfamily protein n=1 Tax=Alkalitalea saponilacus TaxID=889453 RepID=A0A1T5ADI7_9BACT|nr:LamG-like jellyroll fold domain-containing protein [Alkalitalea saponilacus]ASB48742.1 hypothetical protein CDL62_06120 [Alkalitalea saponilacus]SKB32990.1 Concanavalin A-like lectin/glucanases superfamily protein [Alkalitalea saponilacus]